MKKLILPIFLTIALPLLFSCAGGKFGSYRLNERDAADAVRQMLQLGVRNNSFAGSFSKEMVLSTLFPEPVKKALNTLNQLGLTREVDRFTTTLSAAAEKTAVASVPIFEAGIANMKLNDAMRIITSNGTPATDYLRSSVGDSLRRAIVPNMQSAINEYKLSEQWDDLIKPVKGIAGGRLNLDLANLMAGAVSESMFRKIAEKEALIRSQQEARTTPLLQKVFYRR